MGKTLKVGMVALVALSITVPLYGCEGRSNEQIHEEVFDYIQDASKKVNGMSDAMIDTTTMLQNYEFENIPEQAEYVRDLNKELKDMDNCPEEAEDFKKIIEDVGDAYEDASNYFEKAANIGDIGLASSYIELSTDKMNEATELMGEATEEMKRLDKEYSK